MRHQDWAERLDAYIDTRRDMPFAWGTNDCTVFAAGAIAAMTDDNPDLPGYETVEEAARLLREQSLRSRVNELYAPEIYPSFAQRGDLVLTDMDGRETVCVCLGDYLAGPGDHGLQLVPRSCGIAAWKV